MAKTRHVILYEINLSKSANYPKCDLKCLHLPLQVMHKCPKIGRWEMTQEG